MLKRRRITKSYFNYFYEKFEWMLKNNIVFRHSESDFDAAQVMSKIREENPEKPMLACFMGGELSMFNKWYAAFEEAKIPVFPDPGRMVRAAGALTQYADFINKP